MQTPGPPKLDGAGTYVFGEHELDLRHFELRRAGQRVAIEPQVFDVLAYLVAHRDRVVPKEELLDEVWRTRFVTESTLTTRVKAARRAVGDDGTRQAVIRTLHGRGYRFVAEVTEDPGRACRAPRTHCRTGRTSTSAVRPTGSAWPTPCTAGARCSSRRRTG